VVPQKQQLIVQYAIKSGNWSILPQILINR